MSSTEELIASLSVEGKNLKKPATPARFFASWLAVSLASVLVMLAFFGLRPDLSEKLHDIFFLAEITTLGAMVISMAYAAALLSFPDSYQHKNILNLPIFSGLAFIASLIFTSMGKSTVMPPEHNIICLLCISMFSVFPAFYIFYQLRKQAPTRLKTAGSVALLAAGSIGALTLRLSEPTDSLSHLVYWHYLPMTGYILLGAFIGSKLLRQIAGSGKNHFHKISPVHG